MPQEPCCAPGYCDQRCCIYGTLQVRFFFFFKHKNLNLRASFKEWRSWGGDQRSCIYGTLQVRASFEAWRSYYVVGRRPKLIVFMSDGSFLYRYYIAHWLERKRSNCLPCRLIYIF